MRHNLSWVSFVGFLGGRKIESFLIFGRSELIKLGSLLDGIRGGEQQQSERMVGAELDEEKTGGFWSSKFKERTSSACKGVICSSTNCYWYKVNLILFSFFSPLFIIWLIWFLFVCVCVWVICFGSIVGNSCCEFCFHMWNYCDVVFFLWLLIYHFYLVILELERKSSDFYEYAWFVCSSFFFFLEN